MNSRRDFLRSAVVSVCVVSVNQPTIAAPAPVPRAPLLHAPMGVANGCFVESVAFLDGWAGAKGAEAWARLLQWGAREEDEIVAGHAVAVCEADGTLWCWDVNHGWAKLPTDSAQRGDPTITSAMILRKYPRVTARFPIYRHDFPQAPSATASAAPGAETNSSLRDAKLVGARLAGARPVNVLRFEHGGSDAPRESGAVVFVFHGRYCVYVPEVGTVPFRTRSSVENVRLIQDLLRRMLPGVTGVRKA